MRNAVTKDFSRAWRRRYGTKCARKERKFFKNLANRRQRRAFKQGREVKPITGWDVT